MEKCLGESLVRWQLAGLVALALVAAPAAGQEAQGEPQMSAEQQKMMEVWMAAMTPGPQHQRLAEAAGAWTFAGKFWMDPAAPPQETAGTAQREMVLGGRVLHETVSSEMWGMPFQGVGTTGYDNVTKKWWSTWNDNMSTGLMTSWGTCDETMKRCEFEGSYPDAMSGTMKRTRMVSTAVSADQEKFESFEAGPDGKEMKTMELVYTRKK